jgi:hypothetical protein
MFLVRLSQCSLFIGVGVGVGMATQLPREIYSRMNKAEHRYLKDTQDKFTTYGEMLEVFIQEMIKKYELKPLVDQHLTPRLPRKH